MISVPRHVPLAVICVVLLAIDPFGIGEPVQGVVAEILGRAGKLVVLYLCDIADEVVLIRHIFMVRIPQLWISRYGPQGRPVKTDLGFNPVAGNPLHPLY